MTGDPPDMLARLRALLPRGWFPTIAPLLTGVVAGAAQSLSDTFGQITYATLQTRLVTATADWLDARLFDFLGSRVLRRLNEPDATWSLRGRKEIIRPRVTRAAVIEAITDLGATATVIEPWNTGDCGGWDTPALAWDTAGCWGDTNLPFQMFIQIGRPSTAGTVLGAGGWDVGAAGWDTPVLAWSESDAQGAVTDAEIYQAVADTMPAGTTAWVALT